MLPDLNIQHQINTNKKIEASPIIYRYQKENGNKMVRERGNRHQSNKILNILQCLRANLYNPTTRIILPMSSKGHCTPLFTYITIFTLT